MSLLTIAEVLSGETLVSAGGPVDRLTAAAEDVELWAVEFWAEGREDEPHVGLVLEGELASV